MLAAIKSQFYTGGYPKLIASTRGAPLEWTPRNYVSTAVRGLYEPYKNGTTQLRRRSRTTREKGGSWKSGPDDDSGISWRTSRVTHGDDRLKAISRSNRNRSFRGIPSSPSPRFFFCSISSFLFFFYSAVFFFILLGFWQNPCPSVLLSSWYMSDRDSLTRLGSYSATIYLFIRCFSSISRHFPQFNGDIERSQAKSTIELEIDYFFRIVWRIWCNKLLNRILWNYNWLTIAITNRLVTK